VEERNRLPYCLLQSLLVLTLLRERHVVVAQRDTRPRGEPLDRLHEVEMLELADERDRVATLLAAEAKKDALLGADRERRRLLGVERTEPGNAATDALQRNVLTGQRDEIRCLSDSLHVLREDSHPAAG
jgi:hypothetical protein